MDPGEWTGRLVAWLQGGTVLFDRHGALAAAQAGDDDISPAAAGCNRR
ncbi:MAG: hypothetical protein R2838_15580 [Caldilineaceae bacterium]